jgi:hypothetical protein
MEGTASSMMGLREAGKCRLRPANAPIRSAANKEHGSPLLKEAAEITGEGQDRQLAGNWGSSEGRLVFLSPDAG